MTITPPSVELRAGALRLVVRPDLGGCIAGLWHGELPVLCSTEPAALQSPRGSGGFVLAPYSNRLGFRRFRWLGRDHTTLPNFEGSDHSLHGVAWTRPWQLVQATEGEAVLRLRHSADAHWPFDFELVQRLVLTPTAFELHLALTNTDAHAQPVGLGWHPYFVRRSRSRLHVELTDRWENDASTHLPTRRVPQPGIDADIAHLGFDNCFEGWRGAARIRDEKLSLRLTSSMPYLVVYTPAQKDYFCVEPVSHVNNAIHMADPAAHGLRNLAAGQVAEVSVRLEVAAV